jgi:hypothetical protein
MDGVGEAHMSRTQQAIIAVLSLAVVMVFGCLGTYVLVYLRDGRAPVLAMPSDVAQDVSAASGGPASEPDGSDYGYRLCLQDILEGSTQLAEDFAVVSHLAKTDPQAICETVAPPDLEHRAAGLEATHANCPEPSASHLQAARGFIDWSLTESTEASLLIGRYCSGGDDASWLEEAASHIEAASQLRSQGEEEMEAYYESY